MKHNYKNQDEGYHSKAAWLENPVFIQLLGLSPLLAITTTASKGLALGMITSAVCLVAIGIHCHVHEFIKTKWRFVWYLFLTATITTLADLTLQANWLALHRELGIYLPLVACNFALLVILEKNHTGLILTEKRIPLVYNFSYCAGIFIAMACFSIIREAAAYGTVFRDWHLLLPRQNLNMGNAEFANSKQLISFILKQPGALILLGITLAAIKALNTRLKFNTTSSKKLIKVPRARVTGKI